MFVEGIVIPEELSASWGELCSIELIIKSPVQYLSNLLPNIVLLELLLEVRMLENYVDIFYPVT
jgi:hypothetical protein